jgi:hypothetical protein
MSQQVKFETFCDHAARGELSDVLRMLESGEVFVNGKAHVALQRAAQNGHVDVVDCLLRHAGFDPSAYGNRTVQLAAMSGHLAVVERLLQDERVDPSACTNLAVRWAACWGHLAVVERLLRDERVDPSADDNYSKRVGTVLTTSGGERVRDYVFLDPELFLQLVRPLINTSEQLKKRKIGVKGNGALTKAFDEFAKTCLASRALLEHVWHGVASPDGEDQVGFFVPAASALVAERPIDS